MERYWSPGTEGFEVNVVEGVSDESLFHIVDAIGHHAVERCFYVDAEIGRWRVVGVGMVLWNNDTIVARYPKIRRDQTIEGTVDCTHLLRKSRNSGQGSSLYESSRTL